MFKKKKLTIEDKIKNANCFDVDISCGLSTNQVEIRNREGLINKSKKRVTKSIGKIFFDNLLNPLNIVLIIIFMLMIFSDLPFTSYFFVVILASNSILGLIQDFNARRLVSKLSIVTEPKTDVLRSGNRITISSSQIVYEDIIFLKNGDQVPADCVIVEGNCSVNESLLTGESVPINKTAKDNLLSGSYLTGGTIKAKVLKVGSANYVESLQEKAAMFKRPESEIKKTINWIMIFSVGCVVFFGIFSTILALIESNKSYTTFVKELSGSLVSMIPSGMYLLTSLTLAVGVILLAKRRMLVQQLYCIEMLARVDLICLDKTGTLTDGDMKVESIIPVGKISQTELEECIKFVIYGTGDCNPTNQAISTHLPKDKDYKISKYIPFNSANKFSAVELTDGSTIAIGAFGFVNSVTDKNSEDLIQEKSREGYRIICVFTNKKGFKNGNLPMLSKLVGIILISNSVKEDAPRNIKWFQDNGVQVKIISGDNPLTVSNIAKKCGVMDFDKYVNCEGMSNEELISMAEKNAVFGRVSPEQKELLISTFKSNGKTVAMTGDGVNDILALKAANCSIAMANGSSAARNVSHIVSLDSDFSKLPDVVEQGRRVINNLQRSCSVFLSKTLFAVLVTLIVDILYFINGQSYPFSTNNMMIWEMISIGFASFFLALQPSKEKLKGSFKTNILLRAIPAGIAESFSVIFSFIIVAIASKSFGYEEFSLQMLSVLSFTSISYVVLAKICSPFDKYRSLVYVGCFICGICVFLFDLFVGKGMLLDLDYSTLNWQTLVAFLCISIVCTAVYFICNYFVEKKLKSLTK